MNSNSDHHFHVFLFLSLAGKKMEERKREREVEKRRKRSPFSLLSLESALIILIPPFFLVHFHPSFSFSSNFSLSLSLYRSSPSLFSVHLTFSSYFFLSLSDSLYYLIPYVGTQFVCLEYQFLKKSFSLSLTFHFFSSPHASPTLSLSLPLSHIPFLFMIQGLLLCFHSKLANEISSCKKKSFLENSKVELEQERNVKRGRE